MTTAEFSLDDYEGASKTQPALWVTDCQSLYDATHKGGCAPSLTDKRLAVEPAVVKSRAAGGEDLRWIDARYHIADYLTRITAKETMLQIRREEREATKVSSGSE